MGTWRLVGKRKRKSSAHKLAKSIVAKQGHKIHKEPHKAAFFGRYRWEAKVEYDKDKKTYKVYRRRMW